MHHPAAEDRTSQATDLAQQSAHQELQPAPATTSFTPTAAPSTAPVGGDSTTREQVAAIENLLVGIWQDALRLRTIGVHEQFIELGGDSLSAMQVATRLHTALHVMVPVTAILNLPSLASLAALVVEELRRQPHNERIEIEHLPSGLPAPLSFAQDHMWLIHQLQPQSTAYNVELAIRLAGDLHIGPLERSLQEIVRRHAPLRTTVVLVGDQPMQSVHPQGAVALKLVDLSCLPAAMREGEMLRLAGDEASHPFDLVAGPIVRAFVYRLAPREHVLLVSTHHIAADEWGTDILLQELGALYSAYCLGRPSPLPEFALHYADYAAWERSWYAGERYENDLAYWREHAAGLSPLSLPLDHPRPALQSTRGDMVEVTLKPEFVQTVKEFSRREGTTYYTTLLAAFHVLLQRYSGQDDFAVGVPMANRQWGDSAQLIGTFMNTLPVRADFGGNPSFREFLRRVHHAAGEALVHQQLPFERLVSELRPARDLSHTPLYQVICNGLTMPVHDVAFEGLEWRHVTLDKYGAQVDLALYIVDSDWLQKLVLEYSSDLFDKSTIERMLAQYQVLLNGILASPDCTLDRLPLLPPAEREQLLHAWNATERAYPRHLCVQDLVAAQVARTPDAVAVRTQDQQITFAELDARAGQLAVFLRSAGISPGAFVGICLDRSIEMIVALLGILKAGAAYLPLDPAFPLDRLAYMLEDAQAPLLLTQEGLLPELIKLLPADWPQVVYIDRQWHEIVAAQETLPAIPSTPDDLAYIIYTSGSTGKPKGVQLRQRNMVNFLLSMQQEPGLLPQDKLLSVTTLSFDIAVLEIFLPLITGAQVLLASQAVAHDGRRLAEYLQQSGATVMQATPATWRMLIAAGWQGDGRLKALCGGEALPADLAQQLLERTGSLWNMYGPTETTVWSTVGQVFSSAEPILIGRPIANTQLYLLDGQMQPVPTGVVGELYIGGDGVARGYLNRPDLSAERFVVDPFHTEPWARLYRTGDLARYRPGGAVEFLGRADHQVKVRGFRIELGEIESALHDHPAVAQAVVTAWDDGAGGKYLAAYVINRPDQTATPADLRHYLGGRLPHYMAPSAVVPLVAFPLTPNGKVDRKRLPPPVQVAISRSQAYAPPSTPLELQLTLIWESVLGQQSIGIHDNFFEIGGHSLAAARLFVQVESWLGRRLPLATLFQAPTIAQLAAVMQDERWTPPWSSLVPIQPLGSKPPFFCVHGFGGDVVGYRDLALLLGTDQPFYGIQARGLNDADAPHTDVAEMAADYIRLMRRLQPHGPYHLGGYCYGGVVAFEMARQLEAQGERVDLVAVLEGYAVERDEMKRQLWRPRVFASFVRNLPNWLHDNLHPDGPFADRLPWGHKRGRRSQGAGAVDAAAPMPTVGTEEGLSLFDQRRQRLLVAHDAAMAAYHPGAYAGRVTLFRVKTMSLFRAHDIEMGWGRFAGQGVDVRMIDGAHYNFLEQPHVADLAAKLNACLEEGRALGG